MILIEINIKNRSCNKKMNAQSGTGIKVDTSEMRMPETRNAMALNGVPCVTG